MKRIDSTNSTTETMNASAFTDVIKDKLDFAMSAVDDNERAQALLEILVGMKSVPEICGDVIKHHRKLYIH